jgi:hypothetical protein
MFERFNIDYSGFISRVPNWIHAAMRDLSIYSALLNKTSPDTTVVDAYKCAIPNDCKLLIGVSYLGLRLPRTDKLNQYVSDDMEMLIHSEHSYQPDNNGYIITTFETSEEGELKFYYKTLPVELDATTSLYFPLIPDDQNLIEALEWYILKRLLERGHKVREFSLTANNEYLNPAMAWDKHKLRARNSVLAMDLDERNEISNMIRTFLYDKNYYTSGSFNYKSTE